MGLPGLGAGQSKQVEPGLETLPVDRWLAERGRTQIPWQVDVSDPYLSMHQRLKVDIGVLVWGRPLTKRGEENELIVFTRIMDREGRRPLAEGFHRVLTTEKLPRRGQLRIDRKRGVLYLLALVVLPGEYTAGIILHNRTTGEHNVAFRRFKVRPIKKDPLEGTFRNLPPVELVPSPPERDHGYWPDVTTGLYLPVESSRRIDVQLLVAAYPGAVPPLMPLVKVLSELHVVRGSMRMTFFDLEHSRVLYEVQDGIQPDWARLVKEFRRADVGPGFDDIGEHYLRKQVAGFRQFLSTLASEENRVEQPHVANQTAECNAVAPVRVQIIVSNTFPSSPLGRGAFAHSASQPSGGCVHVFHFLLATSGNLGDDALSNIMKGLRPRTFVIESPEQMRKALARMLSEIRAF